MAVAKALATGAPVPTATASRSPCFAWERASLQPTGPPPGMPPAAVLSAAMFQGPRASCHEVELFLAAGGVDGEAAARLRALAPQLQRAVLDRGPVVGTRNPSSVVISRIRELEAGRAGPAWPAAAPGPPASPEVEALIAKHRLDAQAAGLLRRLPPERQRAALELPVHEARNPSAFVVAQLSAPRPGAAADAWPLGPRGVPTASQGVRC
mmetsp:Transcript_31511/g.94780  ORF Transcript_31511/g.94780 Transcript_31511/m.94780 type:complete len:210 (-) Transcript_31511:32-661(-)